MTVCRRLQEHIQDTCFYPVIGICENSHFPGYFVCHFKANARNIVRQTIGIFLDNAVQLRAIFLINFSSQIQGDAVVLKKHHGLTHIPLFLNLFSDSHSHFFADALNL